MSVQWSLQDPKFRIGEQAHQQFPQSIALHSERVTILGYALIDENFPRRDGNLVDAYVTSWNHEPVPASRLYRTVKEFNEVNADALAARAAENEAKARADRIKKYKEAKQVVSEFEAKYFAALEAE